MNRILRYICFPLLLIIVSGCTSTPWAKYLLYKPVASSENTQLQLREMQQRIYDTPDKEKVLKAIINLLQDDQYMIKNVDANLGYFNAVKEQTRIVNDMGEVPLKDIYEVTVNIAEYGNKSKVRVTFLYKCMQLPFKYLGAIADEREIGSTDIYDAQFYQDFFMKLDKALFIEGQKL
jgi:hypothetical protein